MTHRHPFITLAYYVTSLTLITVIAALVGYELFGKSVVTWIYEGRSFDFLNSALSAHRSQDPVQRTLPFYFLKSNELLLRWGSQFVQYAIWIQVIGFFVLCRNEIAERLKTYFSEADSPINLAMARIIIFGVLALETFKTDYTSLRFVDISTLATPWGFGFLSQFVPISAQMGEFACYATVVFCLFTVMGFLTRFNAIGALACSWYALLLPQLLGKAAHNHHVWWFALILAFSRCDDALAIESYLKSVFQKTKRKLPKPSVIYGLPLRFMWILFGIVYFFPGLKKLLVGGYQWFTTDHIKYWIFERYAQSNYTFVPSFPIENYPYLLKLGGFFTITWEMSFIVLILFPTTRILAPLLGLVFHTMTRLTMGIMLFSLQFCYLTFIDWHGLFQWIARLRNKTNFIAWQSHKNLSVSPSFPWKETRLVMCIGIFLLAINFGLGHKGIGYGWPFATYPAFAQLGKPKKEFIYLYTKDLKGELSLVNTESIEHLYSASTRNELMRRALKYHYYQDFTDEYGSLDNLLSSFSQNLVDHHSLAPSAVSIQFHKVRLWLAPDKQHLNPIVRTLIFEYPITNKSHRAKRMSSQQKSS